MIRLAIALLLLVQTPFLNIYGQIFFPTMHFHSVISFNSFHWHWQGFATPEPDSDAQSIHRKRCPHVIPHYRCNRITMT